MSAQRERVKLTRTEEVSSSNDHIAEQAIRFHFVSRVPMLCECSDPKCQSIVLIGLKRYQELRPDRFFTAPGHTIESAQYESEEGGYWLHQPLRRQPRISTMSPSASA